MYVGQIGVDVVVFAWSLGVDAHLAAALSHHIIYDVGVSHSALKRKHSRRRHLCLRMRSRYLETRS